MSGWSGVEDDHVKVVLVETLENLPETRGLINSWDATHDLLHEALALLLHFLRHTFHSPTATCSASQVAQEASGTSAAILGLGVDFHCKQVLKAFDLTWLAIEFLVKRVT